MVDVVALLDERDEYKQLAQRVQADFDNFRRRSTAQTQNDVDRATGQLAEALLPVLEDGGERIAQSLAIIEYLDECHPEPSLLPAVVADRAWVRQIALAIACDIHPLNNLRVLKYLTGPLGLSEEQKQIWIRHWIELGLQALEIALATSPRRGAFCFGDKPTLADCCLVPQLFNAERFGMSLEAYPTLRCIAQACDSLKAFQDAHPANQRDAE